MRSLEETLSRWHITKSQSSSLEDLRRAVRHNVSSGPCSSGCRSVCWKMFLLADEASGTTWNQSLEDGRRVYHEQRDRFLKYIYHPEALTELAVDPLADDPETQSPWNTVRQDEITRAEIQQDVQRLPDEANYHEQGFQAMVLNILFIYCKAHPDGGGYRQGMHELLAPLVHVLEQDSLDRGALDDASLLDQAMLGVLDAAFIEHDAYSLFSQLMRHAKSSYEVSSGAVSSSQDTGAPFVAQEQRSAIVDRSRFIHEVCLRKVDPELSHHLSDIEILPQIFLIRWIRLLFSREFPFNQLLMLWDTIFAADPSLELVDLVCVAMLIRIRWQLLEADYSVCLQLLLKYPGMKEPHGPQTLIDDAIHLRHHLDIREGSDLITKYTGKTPTFARDRESDEIESSRRVTNSIRRKERSKSPTASASGLMHSQSSMDSILQGAAKRANRVFERSEQLGINQAVRDAMGEIRRNVQNFNEARQPPRLPRSPLSDEGAAAALAGMERRNRQLASLLYETVTDLRTVSMSDFEDKVKSLELIEVAAAKVQFVQIYLEDSTMDVPVLPPTKDEALSPQKHSRSVKPNSNDEVLGHSVTPSDGELAVAKPNEDRPGLDDSPNHFTEADKPDAEDCRTANPDSMQGRNGENHKCQPEQNRPSHPLDSTGNNSTIERRPGPVPTRSTLAQSSFSWMLEPGESSPSRQPPGTGPRVIPTQHKKRASASSMSRERSAFLFGEVTSEAGGSALMKSEDIFGMEPISSPKGKNHGTLFDDN